MSRWTVAFAMIGGPILWGLFWLSFFASMTAASCRPEPVTPSTPTGIAGCEVWGAGTASHYAPGDGVAMNFCTWGLRHSDGCGSVEVTSVDTGLTVTAPVVDFCDCYTGTADQRIVDLQYGVVAQLGLDLSRGLYPVVVEPAGRSSRGTAALSPAPQEQQIGEPLVGMPDTAIAR